MVNDGCAGSCRSMALMTAKNYKVGQESRDRNEIGQQIANSCATSHSLSLHASFAMARQAVHHNRRMQRHQAMLTARLLPHNPRRAAATVVVIPLYRPLSIVPMLIERRISTAVYWIPERRTC